MARLKKEGQRSKQPDLLHHQAKSVVAFLVFLGAPWEAIKTIMLAKVSKWPVCKLRSNDISEELIKKWATDAVKKEPGICDLVLNPEHPQTIRTTRWLMEWKTVHWVNSQNMKGIPVPSALVRDHYRSLWGMGPHQKAIANHLDKLDSKKLSFTNWMRDFRDRWGFIYKGMPIKAPMTKDEITTKVGLVYSLAPRSKKQPPRHFQETQPRPKIGYTNMVPNLGPDQGSIGFSAGQGLGTKFRTRFRSPNPEPGFLEKASPRNQTEHV